MRSGLRCLPLMIALVLVGCAGETGDDEAAGDDGEAVTSSTDIGGGWTKQVLGASAAMPSACRAASGEEPCATRFRGHAIAGAQKGVSVVRGNGPRYFFHVQSESPWLHFSDTLEDETARAGTDASMLYVGGAFS